MGTGQLARTLADQARTACERAAKRLAGRGGVKPDD
jgi:hypothetical protein